MKYLIVLCAALVLASCAQPEPQTVVQTQYIEKNITIVPRPEAVNLTAPQFYVVNAKNFNEFIERFSVEHGSKTFIVLSVKDYENLSLSVAELKRYIEQQNEIIVYYEEQVK